jgi:flavin reductase (DIM6/NTAB) family NADH-FMN oxidoreductase RutF
MGEFDKRKFRDACSQFGTGVTVIATSNEEGDHGMTANAFMSISLEPPLIAVSIGCGAKMCDRIERSGRFAVSILAHGTEKTAWHFAGRPDQALTDPFERVDELPVVRGALAYFIADVVNDIHAGDHRVLIGQVTALEFDPAARPLLFHRGRFSALPHQDELH